MPTSIVEPLSEQARTDVDAILSKHQDEPGSLIPILQETQGHFGYLPKEVLRHIAEELRIPYSQVTGVVTFYSYFTTVPRGKHTVRVCLGTACYVRGGKEVLDGISRELGIEVGNTTDDRHFSLEIGRCFGACGLAPVVMVDDVVHQRVNPNCIREILAHYRRTNTTEDSDDRSEVSTESHSGIEEAQR